VVAAWITFGAEERREEEREKTERRKRERGQRRFKFALLARLKATRCMVVGPSVAPQ
jgi:hypothetical protein